MVHPARESDESLIAACQISFTRRGGPGGQHRNKTETAVVIEHVETGLRGEASERRSQALNRRLAIFRLRLALATEVRVPVTDDSTPSELWLSRVNQQRLSISESHADFPSLLAEALDHIVHQQYQIDVAAKGLLVSSTQLVKLLKLHRPALEQVNLERQHRGFGPLR